MCLLFSKIFKRGLQTAGSMKFFKHVTHYGPWLDFLYYNLTPPIEKAPLSPTQDALSSSASLSPMNLLQYLAYVNLIYMKITFMSQNIMFLSHAFYFKMVLGRSFLYLFILSYFSIILFNIHELLC